MGCRRICSTVQTNYKIITLWMINIEILQTLQILNWIHLVLHIRLSCRLNHAYTTYRWLNTLRPRQNGRHFPDNIFKWIFLNENIWISINISLKFVPRGLIDNIPTLVQVMAWRRPGDKPLSEPMMVRLPTHICVTRPQWVNVKRCNYYIANTLYLCHFHINSLRLTDAYMH